jgi:hypothetical protein
MLLHAHCAAASIRTGGAVVVGRGFDKEFHAAMSSVVHISRLMQEEQK